MFYTWKESFYDFIVEDKSYFVQCSLCHDHFDDHYHSAMCERCYYEDISYCSLDTTVNNMDELYGILALEEGILDMNPHFIRDFIGTFMEIYDSRYERVPVPAFEFAATIRTRLDLLIRPGEREMWKVPLTLGILYYAFFEPRGIALSEYIEVWLSLLPSSMIYHTDGFIASVKTAAEVPFAIAASRFNIEYLIAMIHSVIYTEDIVACLVPHISTTVGLEEALLVIDSNMSLHSSINECNGTGLVEVDRERSCADPLFWEPLLTSLMIGDIDIEYGYKLDVVISADSDDIGMWSADVMTPYGEYSVYVRRECCNISPGFGPEVTSMHALCTGRCGAYSPMECGYDEKTSMEAHGRYWRHVSSTLLCGSDIRPRSMHHKWAVMSVMDTADGGWVMAFLEENECMFSRSGRYIFPNSRWVDEDDYIICSRQCRHIMCHGSGVLVWHKPAMAVFVTNDECNYFLSEKELSKMARRRAVGYTVPWQIAHLRDMSCDSSYETDSTSGPLDDWGRDRRMDVWESWDYDGGVTPDEAVVYDGGGIVHPLQLPTLPDEG